MRVFLYEFVTGGGFLELDGKPRPEGSLLVEGEAMWRAIYDDFAWIDGVEVCSLRDARLPHIDLPGVSSVDHFPRESFFNLLVACDYCLLIAPEFDGVAASLTQRAELAGAKLLSPCSEFVQLAADKTRTAELLSAAGVQAPRGVKLEIGESMPTDFPFPAVAKVNDGAGSMVEILNAQTTQTFAQVTRVEQLVNGIACSISFLCQSEREPIACPPMRQILSRDGKLTYLGGQRIMQPHLIRRATTLGLRAIATMPRTVGYVGIDLVLADTQSEEVSAQDFVIEVNPRQTTSYIGLREIAKTNLASAMLDAYEGRQEPVEFSEEGVHFRADGTVI